MPLSVSTFFTTVPLLLWASAIVSAFQPPSPHTSTASRIRVAALRPLNALSAPELDDSNYRQVLGGATADGRAVLVDCCAPWCGPCRLIEPVLEDASERWKDQVELVKFDVEGGNVGGTKVELLLQGVMPRALPSLILFHEGKAVAQHKGVITSEQLDAFLESNIPQEATLRRPGGRKEEKKEPAMATAGFVSFANRGGDDDYMLSMT